MEFSTSLPTPPPFLMAQVNTHTLTHSHTHTLTHSHTHTLTHSHTHTLTHSHTVPYQVAESCEQGFLPQVAASCEQTAATSECE